MKRLNETDYCYHLHHKGLHILLTYLSVTCIAASSQQSMNSIITPHLLSTPQHLDKQKKTLYVVLHQHTQSTISNRILGTQLGTFLKNKEIQTQFIEGYPTTREPIQLGKHPFLKNTTEAYIEQSLGIQSIGIENTELWSKSKIEERASSKELEEISSTCITTIKNILAEQNLPLPDEKICEQFSMSCTEDNSLPRTTEFVGSTITKRTSAFLHNIDAYILQHPKEKEFLFFVGKHHRKELERQMYGKYNLYILQEEPEQKENISQIEYFRSYLRQDIKKRCLEIAKNNQE